MIDLNEALLIAKDFFWKKGRHEITKVYELEDRWIIFEGIKGKVKFGQSGICIDKITKKITPFILPSKENFALLKKAVLVNFGAPDNSGDNNDFK